MNLTVASVFTIYLLSLLAVGGLALALIVGSNKQSKKFTYLMVVLTLWLLPQFMAQFIFYDRQDVAMILVRLSLLLSGLVALTLNVFVLGQIKKLNSVSLKLLIFIMPVLSIVTFLPITNINIQTARDGIAVTSSSFVYNALIYGVFLDFIVAIIAIYRSERQGKKNNENVSALRSLRYSLSLAIGLNIIGAVFLAQYKWSQVLTPLSMALMAIVAYVAIFKHRLFDIRQFFARSLAYVGTVGILGLAYGAIAFGFISKTVFRNDSMSVFQELVQILVVLFAAYSFRPVKVFFDKVTNRYFYRDAYDAQQLLNKLNKTLVSSIDLDVLLSGVSALLESTLKIEFCGFYIEPTEHTDKTVVKGSYTKSFEFVDQFILTMTDSGVESIVTDQSDNVSLSKAMSAQRIAAIMRLGDTTSSKNGMGYIITGQKKSGNPYTSQDTEVLEIISNELVIAVQNALRFEEIQNFAVTLQDKVNQATAQLKKSNAKLKALDEAKDEFISMASHQLRTPLTSVKGYVSMVLEGDTGKITEAQRKMLDQAFVSSQRMVYLIADLLNVSRLKTGKFIIEAKPTNLADVIEQEISQLIETAKGRDLELTYDKPKDFPLLMLDETKIRQVIMNFADNAIYYTPAGGHIKVGLADKGQTIEFTVTDDGLGVPKAEQPHLFTKFFRAGNAKQARPDGTGLGLFMAKKVIVAQGGALVFKSEEGKGSTFGFSFEKAKLTPTPEQLQAAANGTPPTPVAVPLTEEVAEAGEEETKEVQAVVTSV